MDFFVVIFLVPFLISARIGFANSALLKFKGEDQWLWLNHEKAHGFNIDVFAVEERNWVVTMDECKSSGSELGDKLPDTGLSGNTIKIICNSFVDDEESAAIDKIIENRDGFWFRLWYFC